MFRLSDFRPEPTPASRPQNRSHILRPRPSHSQKLGLAVAAALSMLPTGGASAQLQETKTSDPIVVTVSPSSKVMSPGESFKFSADIQDSTCGKLCSHQLYWVSSDPENFPVDSFGRVSAKGRSGLAVIQAFLATDVDHIPGEAGAMIGRMAQGLQTLPASYVIDVSRPTPKPDAVFDDQLRLLLDSNSATQALRRGDRVLFDDRYAVEIETVELPWGTRPITVAGRALALHEIFDELQVDISSEQYAAAAELKAKAMGSYAVLEKPLTKSDACDLELVPVFDGGLELHLGIDQGIVTNLSLIAAASAGLEALPQSVYTQIDCTVEALDITITAFPVVYLPGTSIGLSAWGSLHAKIIAQLAAGSAVQSPLVTVSGDLSGGIDYRQETGLQARYEPSQPDVELEPNGVSIDDPGDGGRVVVDAEVSIEMGLRATFYLSPIPQDLFAMRELDFAVLEIGAGRHVELPAETFLSVASSQYQGPTLADYAFMKFWPVKKLGLAEDGFFKYLFQDNPGTYVELPPVDLLQGESVFPKPVGLTVSERTIYGGTGAVGVPGCTHVGAARTEWSHPIIPEVLALQGCRISVWPDRPLGWLSVRHYDGLQATICAEDLEDGDHFVRAECAYGPYSAIISAARWKVPSASQVQPLTVRTSGALVATPGVIDLELPVGGSAQVEATAVNTDDTAASFTVTSHSPYIDTPIGTFTAPAGGTADYAFEITDCPSPGSRLDIVRLEVDGGTDNVFHTVNLKCLLFDVAPRYLRTGGKVGDSWSTSFAIQNLAQADLSWSAAGASPSSGTTAVGGSSFAEVTGTCGSRGTSYRQILVDGTASGASDQIPVTVRIDCADPVGTSWGDPHLETFDGVRYNFQAAGEFVLARAPGFEVQVRQVPLSNRNVAINRAAAMNVGGDRVAFYVDPPPGGGELMIDGETLPESELPIGTTYDLNNGGHIERPENRLYIVRWPGSFQRVEVRRSGGNRPAIHLAVEPGNASTVGLLGGNDGILHNDFQLRDGTRLNGLPPSHALLHDCTGTLRCFAFDDSQGAENGGWVIRTHAESLFDYAPGTGPLDWSIMDEPPSPISIDDFDAAARAAAREQCLSAGVHEWDETALEDCILDYLLTGEIELASMAQHYADPDPGPPLLHQCSSVHPSSGIACDMVSDGVWGVCNSGEWAADGWDPNGNGAWVEIDFAEPRVVSAVTLIDRVCEETTLNVRLEFSDGSMIETQATPAEPLFDASGQVTLDVSPRLVEWVKVWITETDTSANFGAPNPGLAEVIFH